MSEWFDVLVYAVLNVTLWFMLPRWAGRFALLYLIDRNPAWVPSRHEQARRLSSTVALRVICGVWGTFSVATLVLFQIDVLPEIFAIFSRDSTRWEALKDLNSMLLIPGAVVLMVAAKLHADRMKRMVPPADRRQAALAPRTLNDFVPRPLQLGVYGLAVLVVSAWLAVAAAGVYTTPKFWGRFALLLFLCGVFTFFVRVAVTRPPQVMDRIFGPAFRAGEVRFAFAQQLLPPVIGAWRLYEEVANTVLMDVSRAMHLGVAFLITAWALRLMMYPSSKSTRGDQKTGATLGWSTP